MAASKVTMLVSMLGLSTAASSTCEILVWRYDRVVFGSNGCNIQVQTSANWDIAKVPPANRTSSPCRMRLPVGCMIYKEMI